jgi:hypothetical protein
MGKALLYYLLDRGAPRRAPARRTIPDRQPGPARPSPRAHRARGLSAGVVRRVRTVLASGSP